MHAWHLHKWFFICSCRYLARMFFHLVILASSLEFALLQTSNELIPFEPIQYLKSLSISVNGSSIWNQLLEAGPEEIGQLSSLIKRNLHSTLQETETVIFAKGERIITKKLSSKSVLKKLSRVPYANLMAIFSVSMTILLEGFQSTLINKPIGEILKGENLLNPIIQGYESKSLLEILCMLPHADSNVPILDSDIMIDDLTKNGEAALFFVNSVLGDAANEAWMDALMAFNIENYVTDAAQLKLSLHNLFQCVLTVIHDFHHMKEATAVNLPLQNQRYLFGWWLNCPGGGDCIFPDLPNDLIFSVSSSLRMYVSPTLELSLIISDAKPTKSALKEVIRTDRNIWKQIYSTLNNIEAEDAAELGSETTRASTREDFLLIHRAWPILVFIFWVVSSHIWVYWMLHCCWFVATSMSKRTHIPRPKLAMK